jgi:hypothetical protein
MSRNTRPTRDVSEFPNLLNAYLSSECLLGTPAKTRAGARGSQGGPHRSGRSVTAPRFGTVDLKHVIASTRLHPLRGLPCAGMVSRRGAVTPTLPTRVYLA